MAKTFTDQCHLLPFSGTHTFEDGDGINTREAMDFVRDCNNLLGYCATKVGFVAGSQSEAVAPDWLNGIVIRDFKTSGSQDIFVAQVPTLVPPGAKRLVWTAGVYVVSTAAITATINSLTLTLSPRELYTTDLGLGGTYTAPLGAKTRTVTVSLSSSSTTRSAYKLVDDTTTGMTDPPFEYGWLGREAPGAYLIITANVDYPGSFAGELDLQDLTWWYKYE